VDQLVPHGPGRVRNEGRVASRSDLVGPARGVGLRPPSSCPHRVNRRADRGRRPRRVHRRGPVPRQLRSGKRRLADCAADPAAAVPGKVGDTANIVFQTTAPVTSTASQAAIAQVVSKVAPFPHVVAVQSPFAPGATGQVSAAEWPHASRSASKQNQRGLSPRPPRASLQHTFDRSTTAEIGRLDGIPTGYSVHVVRKRAPGPYR
jgi:hypothetical protein